MNPIKPTIGRSVLVTLPVPKSEGNPLGIWPGAGIVVGVDADESKIWCLCAAAHFPVEVRELTYSEDDGIPGTWHWMPYQKEQAAKHDAAKA